MEFQDIYKQVKSLEAGGLGITAYWETADHNESGSNSLPVVTINSEQPKAYLGLLSELSYKIFYELALPNSDYHERNRGTATVFTSEYRLMLRYTFSHYKKQDNRFCLVEEAKDEELILMEENALYNFVYSLYAQGNTLTAKWEGGGDSSFVDIQISGADYPSKSRRLTELQDLIQSEIGIPHTGDYYNEGYGNIYVDEQCIYIVTSFFHYQRYPEPCPEVAMPELNWELAGLKSVKSNLKRSTVRMGGILKRNGDCEVNWHIRIREGDTWNLSETEEVYLRNFLKGELSELKFLFSVDTGGYQMEEIRVWSELDRDLTCRPTPEPVFVKVIKKAEEELYFLYEKW